MVESSIPSSNASFFCRALELERDVRKPNIGSTGPQMIEAFELGSTLDGRLSSMVFSAQLCGPLPMCWRLSGRQC